MGVAGEDRVSQTTVYVCDECSETIPHGQDKCEGFRVTPPYWARRRVLPSVSMDLDFCSPPCIRKFFARLENEGKWSRRFADDLAANAAERDQNREQNEFLLAAIEAGKALKK